MKTFGRAIALTAALTMALVISACGGSGSQAASSAASSGSASASTSASASSTASDASSTSASSASTPTVKGAISGDTYANDYFKVQFKLPEGFKFYTADQLAELNGGDLTNEQAVERLQQGAEYFDAAASFGDAYPTVSISVVYAGTPEAKALDADGFAKYMATGSGEAGTYKNNESGDEFAAMKRSVLVNGQTFTQQALIEKQGDYFLVATATSADGTGLDELLCNVTRTK